MSLLTKHEPLPSSWTLKNMLAICQREPNPCCEVKDYHLLISIMACFLLSICSSRIWINVALACTTVLRGQVHLPHAVPHAHTCAYTSTIASIVRHEELDMDGPWNYKIEKIWSQLWDAFVYNTWWGLIEFRRWCMFRKMREMSSTLRAYCDGLSTSTSASSRIWNINSLFKVFSSFL